METSYDLYRAIREDATPVELTVHGRRYTSHQIHPVNEPEPKCLGVSTLTALVEYLTKNVDGLTIKDLICHVESHERVTIRSRLMGDFLQRAAYIQANAPAAACQFAFGQFMTAETMVIKMQACFVDTEGRALVLAYVGNVREDNVRTTGDDGITQEITVRSGVANVEAVVLPNPVELCPYRTFNEIAQPSSDFVFRAQKGPAFALFEADNGAWKGQAMQDIKSFMEDNVPGLQVIA